MMYAELTTGGPKANLYDIVLMHATAYKFWNWKNVKWDTIANEDKTFTTAWIVVGLLYALLFINDGNYFPEDLILNT